jgi:probable FeS assembly SUF system protein SufT
VTPSRPVVELDRSCRATIVPFGLEVTLYAGERVEVIQRLGGSVTVRTLDGSLVRVAADDADALGLFDDDAATDGDAPVVPATGPFDMDLVTAALRTVYDPEIPVNIVELGLVYRCEEHRAADGSRRIEVDMSMTAPGCGMGEILRADAVRAVLAVPGVDYVDVTHVWDPPWSMYPMSEATPHEQGHL